jgi:hypothetical protein
MKTTRLFFSNSYGWFDLAAIELHDDAVTAPDDCGHSGPRHSAL